MFDCSRRIHERLLDIKSGIEKPFLGQATLCANMGVARTSRDHLHIKHEPLSADILPPSSLALHALNSCSASHEDGHCNCVPVIELSRGPFVRPESTPTSTPTSKEQQHVAALRIGARAGAHSRKKRRHRDKCGAPPPRTTQVAIGLLAFQAERLGRPQKGTAPMSGTYPSPLGSRNGLQKHWNLLDTHSEATHTNTQSKTKHITTHHIQHALTPPNTTPHTHHNTPQQTTHHNGHQTLRLLAQGQRTRERPEKRGHKLHNKTTRGHKCM